MPRKHWKILATKTRVSDVTRTFLETGDRPDGNLGPFTLSGDPDQLRTVWSATRDVLLPDWIRAHPGTRPWVWWHLDAVEPRRRVGGIGAALHTVLAVAPRLAFGIPVDWVTPDHSVVFGVGPAVDPADPPRHESQTVYLRRLGLLTAAERAYCATHPECDDADVLQP